MASFNMVTRIDGTEGFNSQSIEERNFQAALIMTECHFTRKPPIGRKTVNMTLATIKRTMEKTLNVSEIREVLAKNVDIWMRLQLVFYAAIPRLGARSLQETYSETAPRNVDIPESSTLIAENHATLLEDLTLLNNLLVIARNMLAIKEVAQDICSTVQLDKQITKLIVLGVNVTSKGYDGENVDNHTRGKLNEITELYKKLLVTCLQFLHNMTMGNDRLKMVFWFDMLFDNDLHNDAIHGLPNDGLRVDVVYEEVKNWLKRNSQKSPAAQVLLAKYTEDVPLGHNGGPLPPDFWGDDSKAEIASVNSELSQQPTTVPVWSEQAPTKAEQDRMYGRVSHEIDVWWKRVRDANYDNWVVPMETVEGAIARAQSCKDNAMTRYIPRVEQDEDLEFDHREVYEEEPEDGVRHEEGDGYSTHADDGHVEGEEEEEEDDDDSYVEGSLRGLLTEIPNILDTKQIEALHMTVKACIVDAMGSGLTKSGENLQKTRCKMFLALDCGKNLLREMLVLIAVWEQAESQFIFQITAQIIESFHHNALLPYAWNSLRILKDIVSPAQTILLRLINYMFRARKNTTIYSDAKDFNRDAKLIHFLYNYFRCRVVPDCIALIYAQAQIRGNRSHPQDFPVDLWDMERSKDGLAQYLDFIYVIADIPEMRPLLIEWETTYELIALLNALEAGVARKPLTEPRRNTPAAARANNGEASSAEGDKNYDPSQPQTPDSQNVQPGPPPLHDTPHKFPWRGIKVQILIILTSLVAPSNGRSGPGNPIVQKQILKYGGIMALLNCCVYDGHNEYLKERATLCIKWVMEGCMEAQDFVRELSPLKNQKQDVEMVRSKGVDQVGPMGGEDVVDPPAQSHTRVTGMNEKYEMDRLSRMADAVEKMRIANVAAAKKE
ncbi:hypothetical protein V492_03792 [Pseudogymnoascus sp. VKM F-4246]|nr:hypothetical protein V492_03792 [Pseudogymnoascus sp. VKM F-4246]KFY39847.1 hypothetical protein V494_03803 [Pseudogymnoascus sp. VKM F-4513 (FW-928)]